LQRGHALAVRYSRAEPQRNYPEGHGLVSRKDALIRASFGVAIALFGAGVVLATWRGKRPA
jgi:hypothetical protein